METKHAFLEIKNFNVLHTAEKSYNLNIFKIHKYAINVETFN